MIKGKKTVDVWKDALKYVLANGEDFEDNDGRNCREIINLIVEIENPSESGIDEPVSMIAHQAKWIYPSKEELSSIMFKEIEAPIYEYTYGGRIFAFGNAIDQINDFVLPLLRKDKNSRRAIINLYDPVQDSDISNRNTPGMIYMQFRIKDGCLIVTVMIRSNDLFFGWPANVYQISELQKILSEELKIKQGKIITISNSAHIFTEDLEHIYKILDVKI